jgi:two-component system copper resistance phosphate regulon response regulator CusR
MKILVIEDEQDIASFLKKGLNENGHDAQVAFDGEMGLRLALNAPFDLVLLDIILPKLNGLEVLKKMRNELQFTNPIIMLTALGATDDIVEGLNSGADDYLVKPIKFKELLARIQALSRRKDYEASSDNLRVADLILNNSSKQVFRDENEILLTAKEFNFLYYLMRNKGRVLSRVDILENVWEINFDLGTNVIDVYMNYLRKKIDKNYDTKLLHTVVGMGYVIKEK